jgi:pantothenate synthetase
VVDAVAGEPLVRLQYASCADLETLEELDTVVEGALLSLAALVGQTRLIDNEILG